MRTGRGAARGRRRKMRTTTISTQKNKNESKSWKESAQMGLPKGISSDGFTKGNQLRWVYQREAAQMGLLKGI